MLYKVKPMGINFPQECKIKLLFLGRNFNVFSSAFWHSDLLVFMQGNPYEFCSDGSSAKRR